MESFEVFCCNLAEAIKESPHSRVELANLLGVKPATIKSWCVGRRAPTVIRLLDLCRVLEVDAEELFRAPDSPQQRYECPVCGQNFRRMVGLRIHVALRARENDGHGDFAEGTPPPLPSSALHLRPGGKRQREQVTPEPRPSSYAASY